MSPNTPNAKPFEIPYKSRENLTDIYSALLGDLLNHRAEYGPGDWATSKIGKFRTHCENFVNTFEHTELTDANAVIKKLGLKTAAGVDRELSEAEIMLIGQLFLDKKYQNICPFDSY